MRILFTDEISIKDSLVFEQIYPESLQEDLESKTELKEAGTRFIYMKDVDTGELIGECYFIDMDLLQGSEPDEDQPDDGLDPYYGKGNLYCYSNTILPKYQKQGFGKLLKAYFIAWAKENGYDSIVGHARDNGSIQLNNFFNAQVERKFDTWYGNKENVYLYTIKL